MKTNFKLPELTQKPMFHIDATPDKDYPLRILRAYRYDCDCNWSDNTAGKEPMNPLLVIMNEQNKARAKILDKAIALLEKGG